MCSSGKNRIPAVVYTVHLNAPPSHCVLADNLQVNIGANIKEKTIELSLSKIYLTPYNMGIGGALGGFLLTNGPIIFSMAVLKTITTDT